MLRLTLHPGVSAFFRLQESECDTDSIKFKVMNCGLYRHLSVMFEEGRICSDSTEWQTDLTYCWWRNILTSNFNFDGPTLWTVSFLCLGLIFLPCGKCRTAEFIEEYVLTLSSDTCSVKYEPPNQENIYTNCSLKFCSYLAPVTYAAMYSPASRLRTWFFIGQSIGNIVKNLFLAKVNSLGSPWASPYQSLPLRLLVHCKVKAS